MTSVIANDLEDGDHVEDLRGHGMDLKYFAVKLLHNIGLELTLCSELMGSSVYLVMFNTHVQAQKQIGHGESSDSCAFAILYIRRSRCNIDSLAIISSICSIPPTSLVLTSGSLARLELVQVPSADGQAALVLVHALAEVVDVGAACAGRLHLCGALVLLGEVGGLGRRCGGLG